RVLCWVALDRLLDLAAKGHLADAPVDRFGQFGQFARERDLIRRDVEERGWNESLGSYVARLGGDRLDASLLLLDWNGFAPASSERMRRTWTCIARRLGAGRGLLYRYRTGDSPGESAFGVCSFW